MSFGCKECKKEYDAEFAKCPRCAAWGSCESLSDSKLTTPEEESEEPINLSEIEVEEEFYAKTLPFIDEVLSGGFVEDNVYLLSGEPGSGKSTLILQVANQFKKSLYVTAEETPSAIKKRANRVGIRSKRISVWSENNIVDTFSRAQDFDLIVVDSIQRFYHPEINGNAGSVSQMTNSMNHLVAYTKGIGCITIAIAQINADGGVAGPKAVEHLADATLHLKVNSEGLRELGVNKNRHGEAPTSINLNLTKKGFEYA